MIVWIHKTDLPAYRTLMGPEPHLIDERELDVQVQFNNYAMSTWVAAGYWYGFE